MKPAILRSTPDGLAEQAAAVLINGAMGCLAKKDSVVIGVVGGRSVAPIYRLFGEASLPWEKVHLLLLDERLVAADHPDSNYRLAAETLGPKAGPRLHRFRSKDLDPQQDVQRYNNLLATLGKTMDITLTSSGEDGHIASLFPGHPALTGRHRDFILVDNAPKPPSARMTAGSELIRLAGLGLLLFIGESKQQALHRFLDPDVAENDCPAKIISSLPSSYLFTDLP